MAQSISFADELMSRLDDYGLAYLWAIPNHFGHTTELRIIPNEMVFKRIDKTRTWYEVRQLGQPDVVVIPVNDMIEVRKPVSRP